MSSVPQWPSAPAIVAATPMPSTPIGSQAPNLTRTTFLAECSEAMKWVQDRSVVLGIVALATTTWLWIDFSVTYDIGTGIFSGTVLGALPSLLILAALLGLALTLIILMPSLLLLVELNVKRPRLVALDRRVQRIKHSRKRRLEHSKVGQPSTSPPTKIRRRLVDIPLVSILRWSTISSLQALIVSSAIFLPILLKDLKTHEHINVGIFVAMAVIVPSVAFRKWTPGKLSFEFCCLIVGSVLVQLQLALVSALTIAPLVLADDPKVTWGNSALCALACVVTAAFLAAFQVVLIGFFRLLVAGKNVVLRSLMVGQLVLVVCAVIAPLGAGLIYAPVRIMGMNGMKCAVLPIVDSERDKLPRSLLDGESKDTAELSFITPIIDDVRYVRLKNESKKTTIAVAKGLVGQPKACSSPKDPNDKDGDFPKEK